VTKGKSEWQFAITDRLMLDVEITYVKGEPTEFSLNLRGFIADTWEELVRYDNAHGTCHRHAFQPDGSVEVHEFLAVLPQTFIDRAQSELKKNAEMYLEEFERKLGNLRGSVDDAQ
jgi:hypothetical protein